MFTLFYEQEDFRVLTVYDVEKAKTVADTIRSYGVEIYDIRETSILNDSDDSEVVKVFILCCKGLWSSYMDIKKYERYDEIIYEGVKTLI